MSTNGAPVNGPGRTSTSTDTPGGDSPNKAKVVSRSGRKIKPKKFADEDDGDADGDGTRKSQVGAENVC